MSLICPKKEIFWDVGKTFRELVQTVNTFLEFENKFFRIVYAVSRNVKEDMLKVVLGTT